MNKILLNEHFEYNNGLLYWKKMPKKCRNLIGKEAGSVAKDGYKTFGFMGKNLLVHRAIFMIHHGYLPKCLDHIDGNRLNNQIDNLREVTSQQNCFNRKKPITNTSGVKGVTWHKKLKKWQVHLMINRKTKYFGVYADIELARLVSETMRSKFHGEYAKK
jgi:hypothetical protein